jgi:DNA topoisomerase IB
VPASAKALADQQRRISVAVSNHLGNTPTVALKSYINPMVWRHTGGMTQVEEE